LSSSHTAGRRVRRGWAWRLHSSRPRGLLVASPTPNEIQPRIEAWASLSEGFRFALIGSKNRLLFVFKIENMKISQITLFARTLL